MSLTANDFPVDVPLQYIPYSKQIDGPVTCGTPQQLDLKLFLPGKKIALTSAVGAFTPACSSDHIPPYLDQVEIFKTKGVDHVLVLTANDPFVNSAWAKALGYHDESNYVLFVSDPNAQLSQKLGDNFVLDLASKGLGLRSNRYSAIVNDGCVEYLRSEDSGAYTEISSAATLLKQLT